MNVAVNFFKLKKSYTDVHVYLTRIFPSDSVDPVADDQNLEEHRRYQVVQSGSPAIRNKKKRLFKTLFKPNRDILFDGKQLFVIGEKVETFESTQFETGMTVRFEYQTKLGMEEISNQMEDERRLREEEERKKRALKLKLDTAKKEEITVKADGHKMGEGVNVKNEGDSVKMDGDHGDPAIDAVKHQMEKPVVKREDDGAGGGALKSQKEKPVITKPEDQKPKAEPEGVVLMTSSTEPTRLLNLVNRWRLVKAGVFWRHDQRLQTLSRF